MDLTREKWLPVVLYSGKHTKIALTELLDNQIRDVAYPRSDFQGAAWQMLIGILQCTIVSEDKDDWEDIWNEGIEPERWEEALQALSPVLNLVSKSPRSCKVLILWIANMVPLPDC